MAVVMNSQLLLLRKQLKVSREKLARRTESVSSGTIRNAEEGKRIVVSNANQIHQAINELLQEAGMQKVDTLGLSLY
ncbi:MAG TPA: hypothetical protein VHV10_04945 [Ktedonobacteraceae bacterium]|jgi:transcriptional regulator with XRE-family HTH domain|nr:hypothetical protein [Ktedonobacteraceae bacterium]